MRDQQLMKGQKLEMEKKKKNKKPFLQVLLGTVVAHLAWLAHIPRSQSAPQ